MAVDVLHIERDLLIKGQFAAAADLPDAGEAGLDIETPTVGEGIAGDLGGDRRARPHQGHISMQDAPELRKLVDAQFADNGAGLRNAWVALEFEGDSAIAVLIDLEELFLAFLRIGHHGTKFGKAKHLSPLAYAVLPEERRPSILQPDSDSDHQEERRKRDEGKRGDDYVHGALQEGRAPDDGDPAESLEADAQGPERAGVCVVAVKLIDKSLTAQTAFAFSCHLFHANDLIAL